MRDTGRKRILIVQGHPDPAGGHYCHALADAYAEAAQLAGREVRRIDVAKLEFPLLANKALFEQHAPVDDIRNAQAAILWCGHMVLVHPLWLGMMPALLKGFLEQVLRPGFAHRVHARGADKLLAGRSAHIVVTMGMPAFFYRWFFGAHGLKALRRSILGFCGFAPLRDTLIGMVDAPDAARRARGLERMRGLGRAGA